MHFGIGKYPGTSGSWVLRSDCTYLLTGNSSQYVYKMIDFRKAQVKPTYACFLN